MSLETNRATACHYPTTLRQTAIAASAIAFGAMLPTTSFAENVLPEVKVEASRHTNPNSSAQSPYKADTLDGVKYSKPIAETPKSITVITKESIQDSGNTDLGDVLKAQPGITIGTGEGGNAFGDRFIIRGFEARNDVFSDGLRDPGVTTRETFAIEQIEVSKGPSSSFAGRGTTGGAVNSVSKKPIQIDFTTAEVTLGTDNKQRYTLDINRKLTDDTGVRLNLLYADRDVPARGKASEQREGLALAVAHRVNSDLVVSADYYHLRVDDMPDGGVPWDGLAGAPVPGRNYYGQTGRDFLKAGADIFTVGLDYNLGNGSYIQNLTRYGETTNKYFVTIPGLSAIDPATGQQVARGTAVGLATPGVFVSASSQNRNQHNRYIGNQTNWVNEFEKNDVEYHVVIGTEFSKEDVQNLPFLDTLRSPNAGAPLNPNNAAWLEQGGTYAPNTANLSKISINTAAVYGLTTAKINTDWEVFGGLRYDYFDYEAYSGPSDYQNGTQTAYNDGFINGHAGVTYSPWVNGNVYASFSTSSNASGEQLDAGANCDYGGLCGDGSAKPERNRSIELGTKWQLFNRRLLLTSAMFETIKSDVLSQQGRGGPITQVGELRVRGLEVGMVGNITRQFSISSGLALLDTEITKSDTPAEVGQPFPNTAEQSATVQLRYEVNNDWTVGGTAIYTGEIFGGTPNGPVTNNSIAANTRYDLMAQYRVNHDLSFRLNILNATDKTYYDALYRSGSPFTYVGEGRSASLTMIVDF